MNNPVTYFEIPVSDLDRAIVFYTAVFGYELDRTEIDGNAMALFPFTEGANGITGALVNGQIGLIVAPHGRLMVVIHLTFKDGRIARIDATADPIRLGKIALAVLEE